MPHCLSYSTAAHSRHFASSAFTGLPILVFFSVGAQPTPGSSDCSHWIVVVTACSMVGQFLQMMCVVVCLHMEAVLMDVAGARVLTREVEWSVVQVSLRHGSSSPWPVNFETWFGADGW